MVCWHTVYVRPARTDLSGSQNLESASTGNDGTRGGARGVSTVYLALLELQGREGRDSWGVDAVERRSLQSWSSALTSGVAQPKAWTRGSGGVGARGTFGSGFPRLPIVKGLAIYPFNP